MSRQATEHLTVRAFVSKRPDGRWYAHCIDLTVDGSGATREEAVAVMRREIEAYLDWAAEREVPPLRRSPLSFRLRYVFYALRDRLWPPPFRRRPARPLPSTFQLAT